MPIVNARMYAVTAGCKAYLHLVLGWALYRNGKDTYAKDYGLTTLLGVGGVFVIGVATLLIGVVLMTIWNLRAPSFFHGETFTRDWAQAHEPELAEIREG